LLGKTSMTSTHIVALREREVTDTIREDLWFHTCAEESIMRFSSSALVLEFTAYTRDITRPQT